MEAEIASANITGDSNPSSATMHQDHSGHEGQHQMIFLLLLLSTALTQFGFIYLKANYHFHFSLFSLLCLWLFPFISAVFLSGVSESWKFLTVWTAFSCVYLYLLYIGSGGSFAQAVSSKSIRKVDSWVPRKVYRIIHRCYQICYVSGVVGYCLIISEFLGFNELFFVAPMSTEIPGLKENTAAFNLGSTLFFYGLYFGVLGRDLIDLLSTRMAVSIGYYAPPSSSYNPKKDDMNAGGITMRQLAPYVCAICGDSTYQHEDLTAGGPAVRTSSNMPDNFYLQEKAVRLQCGHFFHFTCIKGWVILGKKDTCPYCKEKINFTPKRNDNNEDTAYSVDVNEEVFTELINKNPWDKQEAMFVQLLDYVRFFVVYMPIASAIWFISVRLLALD
ncbi:hypothetical protein MP638_004038 [Amoeboaphelidium occidentale]|nr:hypothetical protein MP638_004038 [Amoeboaphelidium occidentale]